MGLFLLLHEYQLIYICITHRKSPTIKKNPFISCNLVKFGDLLNGKL